MFSGKRSVVSTLGLSYSGWTSWLSTQRAHPLRSKPNPGQDVGTHQGSKERGHAGQCGENPGWGEGGDLGTTGGKPRERLASRSWKRNLASGRPREGLFPKPLKAGPGK